MDPEGRGFHNSLWAPVAGVGAATSFSWWWDYALVDASPTRYYRHFVGVAAFVKQIPWARYKWTESSCTCTPIESCVAVCSVGVTVAEPSTFIAVVWARNLNYTHLL